MEKKKFKAVLFDFDGVLADTMNDHFESWRHTFKQFGAVILSDEFFPLEGKSPMEICKTFAIKYNIDEPVENIHNKKAKHYEETHQMMFYPGVVDYINFLHEKSALIGVVSGGALERLKNTVPKHFLDKFGILVTGDKVDKGKPHPDPYIMGAKQLNLDPSECIAIENAPLGIESAKSAGMACIAIASTVNKEKLSKSDLVLSEFSELKNILQFDDGFIINYP